MSNDTPFDKEPQGDEEDFSLHHDDDDLLFAEETESVAEEIEEEVIAGQAYNAPAIIPVDSEATTGAHAQPDLDEAYFEDEDEEFEESLSPIDNEIGRPRRRRSLPLGQILLFLILAGVAALLSGPVLYPDLFFTNLPPAALKLLTHYAPAVIPEQYRPEGAPPSLQEQAEALLEDFTSTPKKVSLPQDDEETEAATEEDLLEPPPIEVVDEEVPLEEPTTEGSEDPTNEAILEKLAAMEGGGEATTAPEEEFVATPLPTASVPAPTPVPTATPRPLPTVAPTPKPRPTTAPAPAVRDAAMKVPAQQGGGWLVQTSAEGSASAAKSKVNAFLAAGYPASSYPITVNGKQYHRVVIGPYHRNTAETVKNRLKKEGIVKETPFLRRK